MLVTKYGHRQAEQEQGESRKLDISAFSFLKTMQSRVSPWIQNERCSWNNEENAEEILIKKIKTNYFSIKAKLKNENIYVKACQRQNEKVYYSAQLTT